MHPAILAVQVPGIDLEQVIFIIMLLIGGFFQWVMNWWKKKQAEAELSRQPPPTPEEVQARENAWLDQIGVEEKVPPPLIARNPLEELLESFRQMAEPEPVPAPSVPLPPSPVQRVVPQLVPMPEGPKILQSPVATPSAPAEIVRHRPRHPLAEKLAAIGGLRHAIVLREIIGPPKALQRADDHLG